MLKFFLEVIVVSILVSLFAAWVKLIPRYGRRTHSLIQQGLNTLILTIVLTIFFASGFYPSWVFMFGLILIVLWASVRITNSIVRRRT